MYMEKTMHKINRQNDTNPVPVSSVRMATQYTTLTDCPQREQEHYTAKCCDDNVAFLTLSGAGFWLGMRRVETEEVIFLMSWQRGCCCCDCDWGRGGGGC